MSQQNPPEPDPYRAPDPGAPPPPPPPPLPPSPGYGAPLGYGGWGYGTPSYPQPGYGGAVPQNGPGTTALVLGVLGLLSFCCGIAVIMSVIAVVMGSRGKRLADQGLATNRGSAQAGFVLGWVGIALTAVWLVFVVIGFVSGDGSMTHSGQV